MGSLRRVEGQGESGSGASVERWRCEGMSCGGSASGSNGRPELIRNFLNNNQSLSQLRFRSIGLLEG